MTEPPIARPRTALTPFGQTLRKWALRHPDVAEGIACEGTAIAIASAAEIFERRSRS